MHIQLRDLHGGHGAHPCIAGFHLQLLAVEHQLTLGLLHRWPIFGRGFGFARGGGRRRILHTQLQKRRAHTEDAIVGFMKGEMVEWALYVYRGLVKPTRGQSIAHIASGWRSQFGGQITVQTCGLQAVHLNLQIQPTQGQSVVTFLPTQVKTALTIGILDLGVLQLDLPAILFLGPTEDTTEFFDRHQRIL